MGVYLRKINRGVSGGLDSEIVVLDLIFWIKEKEIKRITVTDYFEDMVIFL